MKIAKYFAPLMDISDDSQTLEWIKFRMHLLLMLYMLNFNLCCLLVTQCSQNGKFTDLSYGNNFCSERIFKPYSDMWPSLRCHIIVDSSPFDATHALISCSVSLLSMNKLALIFYAFINTSASLVIFMISFSTWVLHPWLHTYTKDNRFFFR